MFDGIAIQTPQISFAKVNKKGGLCTFEMYFPREI